MIYSYEIELEYAAVEKFLLDHYQVDISENEKRKELIKNEIVLLQSLKIWQKNLQTEFFGNCNLNMYFQEMVSNSVHTIALSTLNMVLPSFIMLRKTLEFMMTVLYYSEHPVELYKKEQESGKAFTLKEIKEYIISYPFAMKYKISSKAIRKLAEELITDWSKQYEELSNFVHSSHSKYFQSKNQLNDFEILEDVLTIEKNLDLLLAQIARITGIFNSLYIIFYFSKYISFNNQEKSMIRKAIDSEYGYKKKIVELFREI